MENLKKRMARACALAAACILLAGMAACRSGGKEEQPEQKKEIRIACVGDSITYGAGIEEQEEDSYPAVLGGILGEGYRVRNFGVSGTTAMRESDKPYRDESMYRRSLTFGADIVIIKFGTNDSKTFNWKGKDIFKEQYKELIQSYRELKCSPAIILGTPAAAYDVRGTGDPLKYAIQGKIIEEEVIPAVYEIAEEMNLEVIDFHTATDGHPEWYGSDGIHPNEEGAEAMAAEAAEILEKTAEMAEKRP